MKIAGDTTSMDAKRTYTEVNSFSLGLQTDMQVSPFKPDQFTTRFQSLIGSTSILPTPAEHENSIEQTAKPSPRASPEHTYLKPLIGEIIGQPARILTATSEAAEPGEKNDPTPTRATLTSRLIHSEQEEIFFSSTGTVATEDGREFSFSLDLSMQRTTSESLEISMQAGPLARYLLDPLILSFNGGPATFSDTSFLFDLDCDGNEESLRCIQPGCGFLAFDQNKDGIINDGMELFGPQSGNGFIDLAQYDSDSNLWIDENDPIFDSLSIWRPDEQGGESLQSLREAGVGAISLSHAGTEFSIKGADGELIAQVKANGIFLTEEGEVRSLQELDLALNTTEHNMTAAEDTPSPRNDILGAMTNLRIIIAMQRMRARLMIARERLGNPFQPFLSGTSVWEQLQRKFYPAETQTMNIGETDDSEPTITTPHKSTLIQPLLTLHEMRTFNHQKTTSWWKKYHFKDI